MRFYTKQHKYYCGIDLHTKKMYLCVLDSTGEIVLHRNINTGRYPRAYARGTQNLKSKLICNWPLSTFS